MYLTWQISSEREMGIDEFRSFTPEHMLFLGNLCYEKRSAEGAYILRGYLKFPWKC